MKQQDELREKRAWLNTAQVTIVTPLAIICFALAFLAWLNVRTLQQTWVREREISSHLAVAVQESNHRIKNNLQVIGALIDMKFKSRETSFRNRRLRMLYIKCAPWQQSMISSATNCDPIKFRATKCCEGSLISPAAPDRAKR